MSLEISLHAMVGAINPKTMRVLAQVENYTQVVLINSRNTNDFLDQGTMWKIKLKCNSIDTVRVKVANGVVMSNEGMISQLPFEIQGLKLESDAYVINLGGCDMVLGVTWLQTLGYNIVEFSKSYCIILTQPKNHSFQGT